MKLSDQLNEKTSACKHRKSRVISSTLWLSLLFLAVGACSPNTGRVSTDLYRLPWPDQNGNYALREVKIETLKDPETLDGSAARVLINPNSLSGSGPKQNIRLIRNKNGINIPADYDTMQALSLYAHTEKLKALTEEIGLASSISWPALIAVEARLPAPFDVNNAIYDGKTDALLYVPYIDSKLPIPFNAGIIAHEFFHKIFQANVLKSVPSPTRSRESAVIRIAEGCGVHSGDAERLVHGNMRVLDLDEIENLANKVPKQDYNRFLLRSLNEGLADYFAWVYTGDPEFVGKSLPKKENKLRQLDGVNDLLFTDLEMRANMIDLKTQIPHSPEVLQGLSYLFGTYYSRFLYQISVSTVKDGAHSVDARMKIARSLSASLKDLEAHVLRELNSAYIAPEKVVEILLGRVKKLENQDCRSIDRFVARTGSALKVAACVTAKTSDEAAQTQEGAKP